MSTMKNGAILQKCVNTFVPHCSKEKITEVSSVLGPSRSATEVKISEEKDLSCLTSSDAQDVVSAGPLNSCSFANCSVKIKVQYLQ